MKPQNINPIIKLTNNCNFNCRFCHYTYQDNTDNRVMNPDIFKEIIIQLTNFNRNNCVNGIHIIFHGGEPLLAGSDYFNEILKFEDELKYKFGSNFIIKNSIQTNGSFINQEWINIFKKYSFNVGISIDGDEDLNSHYGFEGVKYSTNLTITNLNNLKKENIKCGILSVITNDHTKNAYQFYNFLEKNNITTVGLCPSINENNNQSVNVENLAYFLIELFDIYFNNTFNLNIREFNNAIAKLLGSNDASNSCTVSNRKYCGCFLTFDTEGNIFFCDKAYDVSESLGNITLNTIDEIVSSKKYNIEVDKCKNFYELNCINCEVLDICAGGCYRNDMIIDGREKNYFCDAYKKIYSHIRKFVNEKISKT